MNAFLIAGCLMGGTPDADACAALALAKAARQRSVPTVKATPAVVAPKTFPHHTGHDCPQCGRQQLVIYGPGPLPGTHLHRCSYDGTIWYHP